MEKWKEKMTEKKSERMRKETTGAKCEGEKRWPDKQD